MSALVAYWSGWVVWNYIDRERLWFARFGSRNAGGASAGENVIMPSWYIVLLYAMSQNSIAAGLALFAGIVAVLLLGFWWVNFRHVIDNETTNEKHKREDLIAIVKRQQREALVAAKKAAMKEINAASQNDDNDDDEAAAVASEAAKLPQFTHEDVARARGFYASSVWRNIVEVFVPSSPAASPNARGAAPAGQRKSSSSEAKTPTGGATAQRKKK
jgi:hypothetical protein